MISDPSMPFGKLASQAAGSPANLLPPMPSGGAAPPPPAMPMPSAAMPVGPLPMMPPPTAPAAPPYSVELQSDGSSRYVIKSPDGNQANDIVLAVNPPPKVPKALQTPAQAPMQ